MGDSNSKPAAEGHPTRPLPRPSASSASVSASASASTFSPGRDDRIVTVSAGRSSLASPSLLSTPQSARYGHDRIPHATPPPPGFRSPGPSPAVHSASPALAFRHLGPDAATASSPSPFPAFGSGAAGSSPFGSPGDLAFDVSTGRSSPPPDLPPAHFPPDSPPLALSAVPPPVLFTPPPPLDRSSCAAACAQVQRFLWETDESCFAQQTQLSARMRALDRLVFARLERASARQAQLALLAKELRELTPAVADHAARLAADVSRLALAAESLHHWLALRVASNGAGGAAGTGIAGNAGKASVQLLPSFAQALRDLTGLSLPPATPTKAAGAGADVHAAMAAGEAATATAELETGTETAPAAAGETPEEPEPTDAEEDGSHPVRRSLAAELDGSAAEEKGDQPSKQLE